MNAADVIIIGGGVIGTACAYFLSRRAVKVLVLERRHLCAGASGASAALITITGSSATSDPVQLFRVKSHRLILEMAVEFEKPIEILRGGSLSVAMSEQEAWELKLFYEQIRGTETRYQFLDGPEAQRFEPLLGPHVVAAFYDSADFHVNPYRLCEGYLHAALRRGASVEYGVTARDIHVRNDRIIRVVTDHGDYHADWVLVAAGAWTPQILKSMPNNIPIVPARGQVIITEACQPLTERIFMFMDHLYTKQTASGNFYLGSHTEFVAFENRITLEKISTFTSALSKTVPLFTRLRAIRFFAGFRPMSLDELPIIGPVPGCSRLIIASGHGRSGMCYSASTGKAVSELIIDGKTELPIGIFAVDRFTDPNSQK
jgi:sarcosine oxidase subunit beta